MELWIMEFIIFQEYIIMYNINQIFSVALKVALVLLVIYAVLNGVKNPLANITIPKLPPLPPVPEAIKQLWTFKTMIIYALVTLLALYLSRFLQRNLFPDADPNDQAKYPAMPAAPMGTFGELLSNH